jgi:post-segregation antitoxin (ccd killing protein)
MTELVVQLPDELAQRAKNAGLLSDSAIQRLLEEAMRREAGRKLLETAARIQAANIPPMTMDEIQAEVDAVRAERRARQAKADDAGRS